MMTGEPGDAFRLGFGQLEDIRFGFQGFNLLAVSTRKDAKVTYLHKTPWQEVHGKATQKLHPTKRHQFLIGLVTVILVGKGHTVVVDVFDACIAEGHGRFHYQDETQFVRQARGSLSETLDHLICALDEEYITVVRNFTLDCKY